MKYQIKTLILLLSAFCFATVASTAPANAKAYQPVVEKNVYRNLTPLHLAVIEGDLGKVKALIASGADVNALDKLMGNAPIHFAAQGRNLSILKTLVENGAFINLQSVRLGATPLMLAVWYRNVKGVRYLLSHPDVDTSPLAAFGYKAIELNNFGPNTEDHQAMEDIRQIRRLFSDLEIRRKQQLKEKTKIYDVLVMSKIPEKDKIKQIRQLIAEGENVNAISPVLKVGNDFHTALLVAARNGNHEIARMLLEAGADQTIPGYYMAAIPLHKAAYFGRADMLKLLSQYPGFHEVLNAMGPNNGYTPLHDAIWHGHTEAAKVLIDAGARTDIKAYDGLTPLMLAKRFGYTEIVKLLEEKNREGNPVH